MSINWMELYERILGVGSVVRGTLYDQITFRPGMILMTDKDTFIGSGARILVPKLVMMDGSQICANSVLTGKEKITIEKNAVVSYMCLLVTATDTPQGKLMNDASPQDKRSIKRGPITIGEGAFVGPYTRIMPGVKIGEFACVGAGSYISRDVDPYTVLYPVQKMHKSSREDYWKESEIK